MLLGLTHMAYILAALLFITALAGLSKQETAKMGCMSGIVGMVIALVATFTSVSAMGFAAIIFAMLIGAVVGLYVAKKVQMTQMPVLIAWLHSFVGLAAVLVGFNSFIKLGVDPVTVAGNCTVPVEGTAQEVMAKVAACKEEASKAAEHVVMTSAMFNTELVEIFLGIFIGAVTFTGSIVAYGKLNGTYSLRIFKSAPLTLPFGNALNLGALVVSFLLMFWFVGGSDLDSLYAPTFPLIVMTLIALVFGVHLVAAIGGADMPVVISMLNSYSGWAAAASGFMLSNDLLIVTGALVGSSGAILSYIMCKAMNRSIRKVLLGGFDFKKIVTQSGEHKEPKAITVEDAYYILEAARTVAIVPGYGLAVAQAQHAVKDLAQKLTANGADVFYAIHPVAGRMPGHMNVLLAEADVDYDQLTELETANGRFSDTDVAIVVGANDVVNPAAVENPGSPLYGMPVLEVFNAKTVFVLKRGQGRGFSGLENELFTKENTRMIYGDAKSTLTQLSAEFKE